MKKIFIIILMLISTPVFAGQIEYMNMDFWNNFNDENLTQNLLKLYDKNYDLKNAALKIKENEQIVKMQFANELPAVALSGEISRDLQGAREQFGKNMQIPKYSQNNYNIPITAGYEIDIWGKNRLYTKSKKEQFEIVKQLERATYISLTSNFAADYFNLIKADKIIEIQDELIKTQEEILNKTEEKYKAGLCPVQDVLAQEKILTSLKEEHNIHLVAREILINSMKVYLSSNDEEISRNVYENIHTINNIPTEYNTDIITHRPDYLQEEANLRRIGFDIKAAKREFLPSFTIFGQIGLNAYQLSSLFSSPSQFFTAGILPSMDLFSGGKKHALLKMEKYKYEQALNDYQKTFLIGITEMNSGIIEYKISLKNFEETKKRMELEVRIYDLAKDKEYIGASSNLDTLIAKQSYLMTKKEEVSNKINTIISTIGLYKASGGVDLYKINENI